MFNAGRTLTGGTLVMPLKVVAHPESIAIVGGYVYRGTDVPGLRGYYLFSDNAGGWIRGIRLRDNKRALQFTKRSGVPGGVTSFGEELPWQRVRPDLRRRLPGRALSLDVSGRFADASGYLNTASFGLPPDTAWTAFQAAAEGWRDGRAQPQDYDAAITAARGVFARLLHVPESWVAVGHQASPMIGLIAASLPDGAEVVVADGQFTSTLFPFLAQERRGVEVRSVPFHRVADAVTPRTSLVAIEAVRSDSGAVADLAQIRAAARDNDARVLADTTQATGWLDIDASGLDFVVCSAYKWLLSPRGTAFMSVSPEAAETLIPHAANWYAGDDIWNSIYGAPLRLARRAALRHLARVADVGRHAAGARVAGGGRRAADRRPRRRPGEPPARPPRPARLRLADRLGGRRRREREAGRGRDPRPQRGRAGRGCRSASTTPRPTPTVPPKR